jgi:2-keto-3-deoxy-L-rhamnonate aldolase RhmA
MAAVPGVDGVMLGPDDIRLESGQSLSSSIFEGETLEAVRRISKACHAVGKLSLGFGSDKVADIQTAISAGLDLISISADVLYVARGSAASRAVIDGLDS